MSTTTETKPAISAISIVALVLAALSIIAFAAAGWATVAVFAVGAGHMALWQIRIKNQRGKPLAQAALAIGYGIAIYALATNLVFLLGLALGS